MTPAAAVTDGKVGLLRYDGAAFRRSVVAAGVLTEPDWALAREVARRNGVSELRAVLDLGLLSEDSLATRLCAWGGAARWNPEEEQAEPMASMPMDFMESSGILVLDTAPGADGESVTAAGPRLVIADPSDQRALNAVLGALTAGDGAATNGTEAFVGTAKEIARYLEQRRGEGSDPARGGAESSGGMDVSGELSALRDMASEAPVVRFFNQAVERAMDLGASDIHLERFDRRISLRYRVDGTLVEQPAPAAAMYDPLLCRIKIMGQLDIAERRLAQDGRIRMRLRGRMVDLRVSLVPTTYGQDAAIRLQDRQKLSGIALEDLGFAPHHIRWLTQIANKSHGILLITGPTGSGKTTTLYGLLRTLVTPELKIITVEDPVEYAMDGVNQIQVNSAINLTFGNTLRNVLRHDPDVILIGEIRDKETAEIAFQASLTGHMVLSTLHTNDVPGTFVRLVDMGVEPYLVNAAVEGVCAQRLLRRCCATCANRDGARAACKACGGIGYRGRVAIMEAAGLSAEVKKRMLEGGEEHRLREALVAAGFKSLFDDAARLVAQGVTDRAEVARVLGHGSVLGEGDIDAPGGAR